MGTIPNHTPQQLCAHTDTFCLHAPRRPRELLNIRGTNVAALVASPCLWESVWWWKGSKFRINIIPSRLPDTPIPSLRRPVCSFDLVFKWTAFLGCAAEQVPWCSVYIGQLNCLWSWLCFTFVFIPFIVYVFFLACLLVSQITGYGSPYQRAIRSSSIHPAGHPFNGWS